MVYNCEKFKKNFKEATLLIIILLSLGWLLKGCGVSESIIYPIDKNYIKYEQKLKSLNKITVYITTYGKRYHRSYHFRNRNYPISLGDCMLKGYTPCMVCNPIKVNFKKYSAPIHLFAFTIIIWFIGFFILFIFYMIVGKGLTQTFSFISNRMSLLKKKG